MARLFTRDERRMAAAGILAGLLTGLLVLVLWFRGLDADPGAQLPAARLPGDSAAAAEGGPFVGALRRQVAQRLTSRPLPVRPLRGPLSFRASDVVWREPGTDRVFARAAGVSGTADMVAANRGDIVLGTVRLERPDVLLRSDGTTWNYESPLAGLLADDRESRAPSGAARTFRIAELQIQGGTVRVAMPQGDFTLNAVVAGLRDVAFAGPGLAAPRLHMTTFSATLARPEATQQLALEARDGDFRFPRGTTAFDVAAVEIGGTRVEQLVGTWDPAAAGYGITARGRAPRLELADLGFVAPGRVPEDGTASFSFEVRPLEGDGTALALSDLVASSGESRVSGSVRAEIFAQRLLVEQVDLRLEPLSLALVESFTGPLPYGGTLTGTLRGPGSNIEVDIVASLRAEGVPERFTTGLTGGVGLGREGLELRDLRVDLQQVPLAALQPIAPGLPLKGTVTGAVVLSGHPDRSPLTLDVRLELGTGLATLAGTVDLTGTVPRYDVSGRLVAVDLQSVLAPAVPPVTLTARYALAGSGVEPATMDARVRIDGGFSGWEAEPDDTLAVVATVRAGTAHIERLRASLATADLAASGNWRFVDPISGAVEYRLSISSLTPFGPYVPAIADSAAAGSVRAEGTISGPLDKLQIAGSVRGTGLQVGAWAAAELDAQYQAAFTGVLPEAVLELTASDVNTPTAGAYRTLAADVRLVSPDFDLEIRADRATAGQIEIVAEGIIPREGERSLILQRAFFDLVQGRWELQSPARFAWGGDDGLRVREVQLRNEQTGGLIELDGRVLPLDRVDVRTRIANLPLGEVFELLGRPPSVSGNLFLNATIRPPGSAPLIVGTFRLDSALVQGVRMNQLEGSLDYAAGVARTELLALFDSAGGRLEVRGTLPIRLALAPELDFGVGATGPLDATLMAERVSLVLLRPFVPRIRNLTGMVDGTVQLGGTAEAPRLDGQLALTGGELSVPELNQRFDSISGRLGFDGRRAIIDALRIRSEGWMTVSGSATFEALDRPVLDVVADLDGFEVFGVESHPDAEFDGRVTLQGELSALVLTGDVSVDDGYITIPAMGPSTSFDFDEVAAEPVLGTDLGTSTGGIMAATSIQDLRLRMGEAAWIEGSFGEQAATAQLRGELTVNRVGDDFRVVGTLSGERGTYTLVAGPIVRRFTIVNSEVRFLGSSPPNPAVDITARRTLLDPTGQRVEVDVRITGTARTPRLALAAADAPNIPQSELLSFLLFGRPSFALGESAFTTGGAVLEQTYLGALGEVLGIELERALSADLGLQLDIFQVQFGQGVGGLSQPTFVVGRQLADDVFLTLETGISALLGSDAPANTWAVRLEWAFDRRSSLEGGIEPANRVGRLRGLGSALPAGQPRSQLFLELRRRWVY
ncbi:MAG TPA: translocation/assembly module TamB domain-containing protein [Longimicrobiales bacterium]|nr:translocation/assembly module TamB domain-containing protein [Longimicrobiales bacterium]